VSLLCYLVVVALSLEFTLLGGGGGAAAAAGGGGGGYCAMLAELMIVYFTLGKKEKIIEFSPHCVRCSLPITNSTTANPSTPLC
jgi:hypothetical protein